MKTGIRFIRVVMPVLLLVLLGACAQTYATRTVSTSAIPLDQAQPTKDAGEPLAVRIETFDPGKLPEDPVQAKGLAPEIRDAEAYYFPVQLKNTMQRSGHWGPVRVVPKGGRDGEVIVNGKILESDGEIVRLEISVKDATGRPWFTKTYERVIDEARYREVAAQQIDPFQVIYNEIANDIAAYRSKLTAKDSSNVRQVAELRFGADFAPEVFGKYVAKPTEPKKAEGADNQIDLVAFFQGTAKKDANKFYKVTRMPSPQDPMVQRVDRLRGREEFLIDTLDQQYDVLARNITAAYTRWRESRLKEVNAIREVDRAKAKQQGEALAIGILGALAGAAVGSQKNCSGCQTTGAVIAGAAVAVAVSKAVDASDKAESETKLRTTTLVELGKSITDDVKPVVIEVEGKTVELKGGVEQKFQQWRQVLKELHDKESGPDLPPAPAAKNEALVR